NGIAFFTQDYEQIDRIFRRSGLMYSKWDEREDYRKSTIEKAVAGLRNRYEPKSQRRQQGSPFVGTATGGQTDEAPSDAATDQGDDGTGSALPPAPPRAGDGASGGVDDRQRNEAIDDPVRLARLLIAVLMDHPEHCCLVYWREQFHRWKDGCWRVIPD